MNVPLRGVIREQTYKRANTSVMTGVVSASVKGHGSKNYPDDGLLRLAVIRTWRLEGGVGFGSVVVVDDVFTESRVGLRVR